MNCNFSLTIRCEDSSKTLAVYDNSAGAIAIDLHSLEETVCIQMSREQFIKFGKAIAAALELEDDDE